MADDYVRACGVGAFDALDAGTQDGEEQLNRMDAVPGKIEDVRVLDRRAAPRHGAGQAFESGDLLRGVGIAEA